MAISEQSPNVVKQQKGKKKWKVKFILKTKLEITLDCNLLIVIIAGINWGKDTCNLLGLLASIIGSIF